MREKKPDRINPDDLEAALAVRLPDWSWAVAWSKVLGITGIDPQGDKLDAAVTVEGAAEMGIAGIVAEVAQLAEGGFRTEWKCSR